MFPCHVHNTERCRAERIRKCRCVCNGVNCVTAEFVRTLTAFVFVVAMLVSVHQFLDSEVVVRGETIQRCCRHGLEHANSDLVASV